MRPGPLIEVSFFVSHFYVRTIHGMLEWCLVVKLKSALPATALLLFGGRFSDGTVETRFLDGERICGRATRQAASRRAAIGVIDRTSGQTAFCPPGK